MPSEGMAALLIFESSLGSFLPFLQGCCMFTVGSLYRVVAQILSLTTFFHSVLCFLSFLVPTDSASASTILSLFLASSEVTF